MDDLISRQAVLDELRKAENNAFNGFYKGLVKAHKIIANMPSAQPEQRWIPVEEHLPKQNEMVLITIIRKDKRYNKIPFISIGYISWSNTTWWCAHDGVCKSGNVEVLAWMPLPEAYKEGDLDE